MMTLQGFFNLRNTVRAQYFPLNHCPSRVYKFLLITPFIYTTDVSSVSLAATFPT
ncbi:hypothetical protein EP10_002686 [Geobacillus icigianus]|uniref:Uncharacterized protein n=1 Tax=Geobacillus icigianus TaxID=1430331 RepID=A0ABU6BIJ9_9BACL|nr:hypothetical protein [Geobacillus icigianus]